MNTPIPIYCDFFVWIICCIFATDMNEAPRYERDDLLEAVRVMQQGGIILYPTDTVWGIGCDACNREAVAKIYRLKQREEHKAMLCLLDSPAKLQGYVKEVPDLAWDLIEMATEPLTIIYDGARNLADNLLSDDGSLGIRITGEVFSKALCERLHHPVVSTSANLSGMPAARNFSQIQQEILCGVDYVVRYRRDDLSEPSPSHIIKLSPDNTIKIIR